MVVYSFNLGTQDAKAGRTLEFKANLVYQASSRTAMATKRSLVFKKQKGNNNNKINK